MTHSHVVFFSKLTFPSRPTVTNNLTCYCNKEYHSLFIHSSSRMILQSVADTTHIPYGSSCPANDRDVIATESQIWPSTAVTLVKFVGSVEICWPNLVGQFQQIWYHKTLLKFVGWPLSHLIPMKANSTYRNFHQFYHMCDHICAKIRGHDQPCTCMHNSWLIDHLSTSTRTHHCLLPRCHRPMPGSSATGRIFGVAGDSWGVESRDSVFSRTDMWLSDGKC